MEAAAELIARARLICGEQHVLTNPTVLSTYRSDGMRRNGPLPAAAILPGSAPEIANLVSACATSGIPYTTRGAGTSQDGGALAVGNGVLLVLSRLRRIISEAGSELTVEAGVPLAALPHLGAGQTSWAPSAGMSPAPLASATSPRCSWCGQTAPSWSSTVASRGTTSSEPFRAPAAARGSP